MMWQEPAGMEVLIGTFERQIWTAAREAGMKVRPEDVGA
jgi:hypothetical protein